MPRVNYTQESLWDAIFTVIPGFRIAKSNGCYLNLPSSTRNAAEDLFVHGINGRENCTNVIRQALLDIAQDGQFCFEAAPESEIV